MDQVVQCGGHPGRRGGGCPQPPAAPPRALRPPTRPRRSRVGDCRGEIYLTLRTPLIPSAAWPKTVQMKRYEPAFAKRTLSLALLPGARRGVFLPAILRSCGSWPLFVTLKTTLAPRNGLRRHHDLHLEQSHFHRGRFHRGRRRAGGQRGRKNCRGTGHQGRDGAGPRRGTSTCASIVPPCWSSWDLVAMRARRRRHGDRVDADQHCGLLRIASGERPRAVPTSSEERAPDVARHAEGIERQRARDRSTAYQVFSTATDGKTSRAS